ncbi:SEC-C domain-containing protein [Nitratidesulfovibrio sp.]|uniref:YecA family protein n=1 Tax=Nitratidesulfovibrio sp. TaxID=2802297 RepID=UPI00334021E7
MAIAGLSESERLEIVASTMKKMEMLGHRLRELIATQPPCDLLGYVYGTSLMQGVTGATKEAECSENAEAICRITEDTQFLLEYVHAVLASIPDRGIGLFDEAVCAKIFECARELRMTAMVHAMRSSGGTEGGFFGPNTADIEAQAKMVWVTLRGNRYMVLEGEFYTFVLAPHDVLLRETYGVGADEIAAGFQNMANSIRTGHSAAFEQIEEQLDAAQAFADARGQSLEKATANWAAEHAGDREMAVRAFDDMMHGGICNVSRHTMLPATLLADLAYDRGEDVEFYADGPYSGTPFRTLPARKKPLVKLGDEYYATDSCFIRDAGYRALLHNLLRRRPDYRKEFEARQKSMTEMAVIEILSAQLKGAVVHREVYYRDTTTRQWAESDTLILIDDMLMLVEAKSGAAATIASPALDFARHTQAVQELVIKAYRQCRRFFEYLQSANEVPIFKLENGKHVECGRLRRTDYRVMLPIGLTVESFSPFSTMCKEFQDIAPILGKHPFLSLSIDELLVLTRFLPTMGGLAHYLEVRQAVAGMKGVFLFDEFDHLGAYIERNRFDWVLAKQLAEGNFSMLTWDGMSGVVDRHFEGVDWEDRQVPMQDFPPELRGLLDALDRTRAPGWLSAESHIRNFRDEVRNNLAGVLAKLRASLAVHPSRNFSLMGETPLFVWLQRANTPHDPLVVKDKASASALAAEAGNMTALFVVAEPNGRYVAAKQFDVDIPTKRTALNTHLFEEADRMQRRKVGIEQKSTPTRRLGRNEPCWCGSKLKFKKCHGR